MLRRFAAKILDSLIMVLLTGLAIAGAVALARPIAFHVEPEISFAVLYPWWLLLVPVFLVAIPVAYETAFVALRGATPGKRALRLRIVGPEGTAPTWNRSFARTLAQIPSAAFAGLGYLIAIADWNRKTLHDRLCNTLVIHDLPGTAGINKAMDSLTDRACPMCGSPARPEIPCPACGEPDSSRKLLN